MVFIPVSVSSVIFIYLETTVVKIIKIRQDFPEL